MKQERNIASLNSRARFCGHTKKDANLGLSSHVSHANEMNLNISLERKALGIS